MTAKTPAERKAEERAAKRAVGLAWVQVWVPADRADEIRKIARDMTDNAA